MKFLYKWYLDCGRQGELESLFIEEEGVVNSCIGEEYYFSDILGKHSEIYGPLKEEQLEILSSNQQWIEETINLLGTHLSGPDIINNILSRREYE